MHLHDKNNEQQIVSCYHFEVLQPKQLLFEPHIAALVSLTNQPLHPRYKLHLTLVLK